MGKKGPNLVHKLDKETRDRHFPEYNGDATRPSPSRF